MSTIIQEPFINNEQELIASMLNEFAKKFQTCIPARVVNVISRDSVEVSPTVLQTDSDGNPVAWANVTTTVLTPFSGGIFISMPLAVGDTGWLVGADLDTSAFKKEKKDSQQVMFSRHRYQYGFFVPDAINGYTVSEDDSGALVLTNTDGTTKIAIKDNDITIKSKNTLKINAKSVTIESDGNANVSIDGLNFKNHQHPAGTLVANLSTGTVTGNTGGAQSGV